MNLNEGQLRTLTTQCQALGINLSSDELEKFFQLYQVMNMFGAMGNQEQQQPIQQQPIQQPRKFQYSVQTETNEELMELFFEKLKENNRSNHTIKSYREALVPYFEWLGGKKASDITFKDAFGYIRYLRREENGEKVYKKGTINARHRAICSFYNHLLKTMKYIDTNFFTKEHIEQMKVTEGESEVTYLTQEESEAFLNAILVSPNNRGTLTRVRDYVMYRLMLTSGLRIQETINLTLNDLDFEEGILKVIEGKGKKDRETTLEKELEPLMGLYLKEREKLNSDCPNIFLNQNGKPISGDTSLKAIKRYAKEAGIWKSNTPITNHTLRHSFATHMITKGYPLTSVSKMLGHASEAFSYKCYVKNNIRDLQKPIFTDQYGHQAEERLKEHLANQLKTKK